MQSPLGDRLYRTITTVCAAAIPFVLVLLTAVVVRAAWPALALHAGDLAFGSTWDVPRERFGAVPAIVGTLLSSLIALAIATPLALGVAIFTVDIGPRRLHEPVAFLVNLLAAIPSVVYGLWGVFVLIPLLRNTIMPALLPLGAVMPLFRGPAYGPSLLAASLVLAIMILPYIASVSREVLRAVPPTQREAALALGATRWEVVRDAVLPAARSGLIGGIMLGLGRALGETLAVAMVIGNRHAIPDSLFDPAYTMASLLANEFAEASSDAHLSALMAVAALLLLITLLVNVLARWLVQRVATGLPGSRWT
ncbi:phosphate ABC transporter permease subunit PstC [Gemmatimonas groenlandica]|uniref:Phosphate transport system permease protein n=1 Tax=Gemmatimonas groenlandica TaxID=2732249 RepID=A0A6M4IIM8_9BACT|nr:phosphate ABC transporter permease subunit PstC [Gemmatimonas groenlandica]QJR34480.1 phosphate ABC transporter permease subunit PstC [Gemmatimonas groenlandica]